MFESYISRNGDGKTGERIADAALEMTKAADREHSAVVAELTDSRMMVLVQGTERRAVKLQPLPFTVGRLEENALVLTQPSVSRCHAQITAEDGGFVLADRGSRHGTFVNGSRVDRHVLSMGDRIQFGSLEGPVLVFGEDSPGQAEAKPDLLDRLHALTESTSELRKLRWLLDTARDMNNAGAVESVLASLIEATLALTQAERGFVLLADEAGRLALKAGRDAKGNRLEGDGSLSQTAIRQATESGNEFILTDTLRAEGVPLSHSMVAHNLRTVICFPLLRRHDPSRATRAGARATDILGVLYLDSRFVPGSFSSVDNDLLRTIAREAAALVENAELAAAEEQARQYREEMEIAARIQKGLMEARHPELSFAGIEAMSVPCKEVGGDFFDAVSDGHSLSVALVDVSGKGISAAILASTLQGMLYMQLSSGQRLEDIASVINSYLCAKNVGKYATMVLLRLHEGGMLEFVNCGHVQPRITWGGAVRRLEASNAPVGLLSETKYTSTNLQLKPECRLLLVSDGVTEAENKAGEMFGDERLDGSGAGGLHRLAGELTAFCGDAPLRDDWTMLELMYRG